MSFRNWQPQYAAHGIATFPVGPDKRPLMSRWNRIGIRGSSEIAHKFSNAEGIACVAGPRNRLTVIDIDAKGERELIRALDHYGLTPLISQTPSGGHHLYFRWAGEGRKIKPAPGSPVDVLGGGIVILPPTISTKGEYVFIQGTVDDLDRLPVLNGLPPVIRREDRAATAAITPRNTEGRNDTLFAHCMRNAHHCDDLNTLLDVAGTRNAQFCPPLEDDEVVKVATSAWGYTERNENWFGLGRRVALPHKTVDRLAAPDPHAYALLSILKRWHGGKDQFVLAKEMADKLGWSLPTFKGARKHLEDEGEIRCITRGGKGPHDPPRYAWP
jgi:hypothetical protein